MEKIKKYSIVIGVVGLIFILTGVTYSFFNYTRTGLANNFRVGNIYFNTSQDGNINLTNVFPITRTQAEIDATNSDEVVINIIGNTDYSKGIEYLVTLEDINIETSANKKIPVGLIVTPEMDNSELGTVNDNYFNDGARGGNTSYYKVLAGDTIKDSKYILVGYIRPGQAEINGKIGIKAYIDSSKILITDTYDGTESDNMGTPYSMKEDKVALTTDEWNSIQGNNNISFKIRVEANEGIWVDEPEYGTPSSCFATQIIDSAYVYNVNRSNEDIENCVNYFTKMWGPEEEGETVDVGETYYSFCAGTGTNHGETIENMIDFFVENEYLGLQKYNIITSNPTVKIMDYDESCGSDVVIPSQITIEKEVGYSINTNSDKTQLCINHLSTGDWEGFDEYLEENNILLEDFCQGTAAVEGITLNDFVNIPGLIPDTEREYFIDNGIAVPEIEKTKAPVVEIYGVSRDSGAFTDKGLTSVVIPNSVTIIGDEAFCDNEIESIVIPDSVTEIRSGAFNHNKLVNVVIPNGITTINTRVFGNNNIKNVVIPSGVTYIGTSAFSNNMIEHIVIPNSVTQIKAGAFSNNLLTSITLPNNLTTIESDAFENNLLTSITLPDSVMKVGSKAFDNNPINSITMLNGISIEDNDIDTDAFDWENVHYLDGKYIYGNSNHSKLFSGKMVFGEHVKEIRDHSFADSKLTNVVFPNGLTTIGHFAFNSSTMLTQVNIPNSVETIGSGAFSQCNLTSVSIGNGIKTIDSNAFSKSSGNYNLSSIRIDKPCSTIRSMTYYPWLGDSNREGTTIYGSNNEVCNSW